MKCGYNRRPCQSDVHKQIVLACVHEHIYRANVCDDHYKLIQDGLNINCVPCKEGSDPHLCSQRVLRRFQESAL